MFCAIPSRNSLGTTDEVTNFKPIKTILKRTGEAMRKYSHVSEIEVMFKIVLVNMIKR